MESETPVVEKVDCEIFVSMKDDDPVPAAARTSAAWFAPLPAAPHSNAVRVEDHGAQRTHAEIVKALLLVGNPSDGTDAEMYVAPGRESAPVGRLTGLDTKDREVLDEKVKAPVDDVMEAGSVHDHASSESVDSWMLAAKASVKPGQIFIPEMEKVAPRSTCHQFVPAMQLAEPVARAATAVCKLPSIAALDSDESDKLRQLLDASAVTAGFESRDKPSAPKTLNSAKLSCPEKVEGVVRRITRALGSAPVEVKNAATLSACEPER